MNLNHLTNDCLLSETERLVMRERELLTVILHHLREIDRRRLFGKYSSLFEYARHALGYSEDQAYRRLAAMRLMTQLPQVERQMQEGAVNLTHIGLAQAHFNQEKRSGHPMNAQAKLDLIKAMSGKSTREAQAIIRSKSQSVPQMHDSVRALGDQRNLVTAEFSDDVLAKLGKLKGMLAHQHPHASLGDLVGAACDLAMKQLDPAREPLRNNRTQSRASVHRAIWRRDRGACVKCHSTYAVEIDHIQPRSLGGVDSIENLRLLCRTCNQREAIEKFGLGKMTGYLTRVQ